MDSFVLFPFKVLREKISTLSISALPIIFLVFLVLLYTPNATPARLLASIDEYIGGTLYLSAANLTSYNDLSTNVLIPLIRLGGIASQTNIRDLGPQGIRDFTIVFTTLFLGFLSYAMVSRVMFERRARRETFLGTGGINGATVVLSFAAAFLILFISFFSLAGFKLLLVINFGLFFTFSIPFAAIGEPLGESIYDGFRFISKNLGKVIEVYIICMGVAIMAPIGLLLFTTPLILNMSSEFITILLKIFLGLFSVMFGLFYQQAICAQAVLETR
ncbi:MAG: hypothetical protein JXB14_06450 [Candidatus Altiarchaeota archaeon]|nr:hypothetical protein [Candidatus Altiarchaeota archaeon]